jgi:hypothetical protein
LDGVVFAAHSLHRPKADELMSAVFASWNLLDALMHVSEVQNAYQTG